MQIAISNEFEVDIVITCYNHAKYLRKCLDSILSQKTSFPFRIIIGDDCSTDNSQMIIKDFETKHPNIITAIYNEKNIGVTKNSLQLNMRCSSKYIVGVESDDYWIDDNRLQKQHDFLDAHPQYVAVGCNYYNVDSDGNNPRRGLLKWQVERAYSMDDYLRYGFIVHGNTLMRRNLFPIDDAYIKLRTCVPTMGDVIMRVLLYDRGEIYCLPDFMHAHRMGNMDKTSFYSESKNNPVKYCYMYNVIVDSLNTFFNNKYDLTGLITGRIGLVIFWQILRINSYDKKEFHEYLKTLSVSCRIRGYLRAITQIWRSTLHVIGRRLGF